MHEYETKYWNLNWIIFISRFIVKIILALTIKMFMSTSNSSIYYLLVFILLTSFIKNADSGPLSGAICSAGCAAVVVACYSAAGVVFGTVTAGAGKNLSL